MEGLAVDHDRPVLVDVHLGGKGFDVHATEESSAWNEAIDLVADKVKKQLVKSKEKIQSHRVELV